MPSIINTNIASMNAQRNLDVSGAGLQTALQRLSSGLRINSAKDDAAGLAISERMTSQIRGLDQATRNANDGISLVQTAEGAVSGMSDNLQRLRELSLQASNATNSAADRQMIQAEVSQLVTEIDRVASMTEFNGMKLLDGSFASKAFQVGANANQTISVSMDSARTTKLGSTVTASLTAANNGTAMASADLILNGVTVGASLASSDNASTGTAIASSGIAKAAAINAVSANSGVTASINKTTAAGASMTIAAGTGTMVINGVTTATITLGGVDATTDRVAVINAINAKSGQTGVVASDSGLNTSGVTLTALDGRNIVVGAFGSSSGSFISATIGITESTTSYGTFTLSSAKDIVVSGSSSIANAGMSAGNYKTQVAYASTTTGIGAAFAASDFKINGAIVGASLTTSDTASTAGNSFSSISKVAAINAVSAQTGVYASVNATKSTGASMSAADGTGTIVINGVTTGLITVTSDAVASRNAVVSAINAKSGQTGVVATDSGTSTGGVTLNSVDGRNIVVGLLNSSSGSFIAATVGITASTTSYGTFTLSSAKAFDIEAGSTGATMTSKGMLQLGTYGSGKTGQSLSSLDVTTVKGANDAITAVDNALNTLLDMRANLGAAQSRFTSTVSSLGNAAENLSSARSRIRDTDFAAETAKLSRGQILQQAGVAMLAQANALSNNVLALLK